MTENTFSNIVPKTLIDRLVSKYIRFSDIELIDENIGSIRSFYDIFQPDLLESDYKEIFTDLCVSGNVECVKWLYSINERLYEKSLPTFKKVCENGHLEMAEWLNFPPGTLDGRPNKSFLPFDHNTLKYTFVNVCKKGDFKMAQWMNREFKTAKLDENKEGEGELIANTFTSICKNGHLEMAKWFQESFGPYEPPGKDTFEVTCKNGQLEMAKWLREQYRLTKSDFNNSSTILAVCKNGDIKMLEWLVDRFKIPNNIPDENNRQTAFSRACSDGFYDIAKYLAGQRPVTALVQIDSIHPFERVCKNGDVAFAQYLYRKFQILRSSINVDSTFQHLYTRGLLDMAKWLDSIFHLTESDLTDSVNALFATICERGHVDFAKWFYGKFKLTANSMHYGSLFKEVLKNNHFEVAEWLCDKVNIKVDDFSFTEMFIHLCDKDNIEVAAWLAYKFGITIDKKTSVYNYLHTLVTSLRREYLSLAKWLTNINKFKPEDVKNINNTEYKKSGYLDQYNLHPVQKNELFVYAFEKRDFVLTKFFFREFEFTYDDVLFDVQDLLHNTLKLRLDDAGFLVDLFKFDKENIDRILKNLLFSFCKSGNVNILNWLVGKFNLDKSYLSFENNILMRTASINDNTDVLTYLRKPE